MSSRADDRRGEGGGGRPSAVLDFLSDPPRQIATLREREHRPWPLPRGQWVMGQTWRDLLFAHWRVDPGSLRRHVPEPLTLDVRDGAAWIAVTPFVVTGYRPVATPPMPYLSTFREINVRTYVTRAGKPGIFFFSLDADNRLAVAGARRFYRLPYFLARASARRDGGTVTYRSERRDPRGHEAVFRGAYRPAAPIRPAAPGSLEAFLCERYRLWVVDEGRAKSADIHHPPWPLQQAEAEIDLNTMFPPDLPPPDGEPLLHFAGRQDVLVWRLTGDD